MGRHPDPRPSEDAAASPAEPVDPATRSRRSRLAGRLLAVALTVLLGGWAAVAIAGAATGALAPPIAAAVPTPAASASAGQSVAPASASPAATEAPSASAAPSPASSAAASAPPGAPQAPPPDGTALAPPIAAAVPTPAASASAGQSVAPASASPSATEAPSGSAAPSPASSATASAPPGAPQAPPPDGTALARPRLTTTPIGTRLQAQLDRLRTRLGIPGVSATIVFRDGTSWTGVSGLADVARKVPVADGTAFAVGSISKTYTAALILALAGEGKIGLDKPAASYLPGFGLDTRITVRMLLDHTSGLDDFFLHGPIDTALQKAPAAHWSIARTLKFVAKPYFPPGKGYHYSNTNYLYLGLIAEGVTKMLLGKALHERFFGPLGLDATWYQAAEKPRAKTAHGYRFVGTSRTARPIDLSDGTGIVPFTSVVTAAAGAGSIATTSEDAATWARLLYSGRVLGPEMTAEMLRGVRLTAAYKPPVPYGLGVQSFSIDGRPTVGHSGTLLGFRAAMRYLPGEATTITVLTNQSRADPGVIVRGLLSVVFAPEPSCFRCQDPSAS